VWIRTLRIVVTVVTLLQPLFDRAAAVLAVDVGRVDVGIHPADVHAPPDVIGTNGVLESHGLYSSPTTTTAGNSLTFRYQRATNRWAPSMMNGPFSSTPMMSGLIPPDSLMA